MINKETVEFFPKGAVITNVARGDIIDDEALIDALNRRKICAIIFLTNFKYRIAKYIHFRFYP